MLFPTNRCLPRRAQEPVTAKLDAAPYDDEELTDGDLGIVEELGISSHR
jgi:hypothetical protein